MTHDDPEVQKEAVDEVIKIAKALRAEAFPSPDSELTERQSLYPFLAPAATIYQTLSAGDALWKIEKHLRDLNRGSA